MSWGDAAFEALRAAEIRQVGYVPDAGLSRLLERCAAEPGMSMVSPVTEEDIIGLACGAWLGGQRAVVLMQSSGVGNIVNALSMAQSCRFPLLMLVTMRGEWGEANPWQVPMGKATPLVLAQMGVHVHRLDHVDETKAAVTACATLAFESTQPVALLISQKLIGAKAFVAGKAA